MSLAKATMTNQTPPSLAQDARNQWRLDHAVTAHAETTPDKPAIHFGDLTVTYAMLADRVAATAQKMRHSLTPGDRFAVYSMNHPESFILLLAAARIGAIMVPLNWRLSVAELKFQLSDCGPDILFYGAEFADKIDDLTDNMPGMSAQPIEQLDEWRATTANANYPATDTPVPTSIGDDVLIVYTSGTTGRPKGAVLAQHALRSNAIMSHHAYTMRPDDIVLNILPLFHVGGLNIQPLPALILGATVIMHKSFDPAAVLKAIATDRITQITTVPTILGALLDHPDWDRVDMASLRMIAIGSTDVPAPLIEAVHARDIPIVQIYGATETSPTAIYQTADIAMASAGSIGRAGCDCAVRLVDQDGQDVPTGIVGEIWVKGDNILSRYWHNDAATATSITDGWFHTGDMARIDETGLYWFSDRLKHVIISGGENIYPAELERLLAGHPELAEFAIVGRNDARWGQVPVVVAVPRDPAHPIGAGAILALFETEVARFKRPKDVLFVDQLPRNALGKIVAADVAALVN